jgi:hypothetical protein
MGAGGWRAKFIDHAGASAYRTPSSPCYLCVGTNGLSASTIPAAPSKIIAARDLPTFETKTVFV